MGFDVFKNVKRKDSSKEVSKDVLNIINKKKNKKAPSVSIVPKTMKQKVEYAKEESLRVFGDKLDKIELLTDESSIVKYFKESIKNGVLAVDTETNGLDRVDGKIAGVCLYTPGQKGVYIPIGHISYMTGMNHKDNVDKQIVKQCFEECNQHNVKYILHNAKFDMHVLHWMVGVDIVPYRDTLIASQLLNENEPHGLKVLYQKYCVGNSEEQQVAKFNTLFNGIEFNKIPPDVGYMYASFDPIMTYELYEFQREYLDKEGFYCYSKGLERVADVFRTIEMPLIKVVFDMEVQGVKIDDKLASDLKAKYEMYRDRALKSFQDRIKELDRNNGFRELQLKHPDKYSKLCENGRISLNIASNQQLAILFYDVLKIESPDPKNPRGTGEEILKKIDNDIVKDILEFRAMSKLLSTYIEAIPEKVSKADGKLHANFNQYGAKTGRFSSDKPNLQNIPSKKKTLHDGTVIDAGHDIRQMFVADDGMVIIGGDFSQQEPRCLAHMSGDEHMLQAYRDNKDLYATIASKLYNKPYDECLEFRKDGTVNPEGKQRRTSVKPILLGIMYGRGTASIAEQMKISKEEAQQVIEDFYTQFPKVKDFVDESQQFARDYGFVQTAWGRKRRLPDMQLNPIELEIENIELTEEFNPLDFDSTVSTEVSDRVYYKYLRLFNQARGIKQKEEVKQLAKEEGYKLIDNGGFIANAERQCVNSIIQGSAADMTKIAMINIHNDELLNKLGYHLIIPVHDEVLGVCPIENAKEVRERLEYLMIHVVDGKFTIPMKTDIEVTKRWYGEQIEI